MSFGQFASTTQFYLYGKKYCTKTGWEAASNQYPIPDILSDIDLTGNVYLVTGANAGIGLGIATFLAQRGGRVFIVCRNQFKGDVARDAIAKEAKSNKVHLLICDCSLEADVRRMYYEFVATVSAEEGTAKLNALICNAGALLNDLTVTPEGVETTLAAHLLFGSYLLGTLALPLLSSTSGGRLVAVSSGGMYNTKFPDWEVASAVRGKYNGQLAYAYAKRGQVLLCERWSEIYPDVKFVSCHPGWVNTPGVDSAYGENKKYLEPMRNIWEGCEGIVWLAVAPFSDLRGGEFYLDRSPCRKHLAGPFFTDGSFTKNTRAEVDTMMERLQQWSDGNSRPREMVPISTPKTKLAPLTAMQRPVDIKAYMGRWYVLGEIRSFITKGTVNNMEDYVWDEENQSIRVSFKYSHLDANGKVGRPSELKQLATLSNGFHTEWALSIKMFLYIPISTRYLILDVDEAYNHCLVGVADRSMLWIMCRTPAGTGLADDAFDQMVEKARSLGYDTSKIERVPYIKVNSDLSDMCESNDEARSALMMEIFFSFDSATERRLCLQRLIEQDAAFGPSDDVTVK